jgi:hypothetical protein
MKITLCTLFNINYLDKGLALYQSLEEVASDFELYVLAMDDKCYRILSDLNYSHLKIISLEEFENDELKLAKSNRPFGEYCWTCSSSLIKYIFETYSPENCTYIDADMYFYDDPKVLIDEMYARNCTVLVVGHRFSWYNRNQAKIVGRHCVEFNTFANESRALVLLNKWVSQCLEACYHGNDGIHHGDQMYIDRWCEDYDFVCETSNLGAGVAHWNIDQYRFCGILNKKVVLKTKGKHYNLLFYHFENLQYITKDSININVYNSWGIDDKLVSILHKHYLKVVDTYKDLIKERFNEVILVKSHPAVTLSSDRSFVYQIKRLIRVRKIFCISIPSRLFRHKNIIHLTKS